MYCSSSIVCPVLFIQYCPPTPLTHPRYVRFCHCSVEVNNSLFDEDNSFTKVVGVNWLFDSASCFKSCDWGNYPPIDGGAAKNIWEICKDS